MLVGSFRTFDRYGKLSVKNYHTYDRGEFVVCSSTFQLLGTLNHASGPTSIPTTGKRADRPRKAFARPSIGCRSNWSSPPFANVPAAGHFRGSLQHRRRLMHTCDSRRAGIIRHRWVNLERTHRGTGITSIWSVSRVWRHEAVLLSWVTFLADCLSLLSRQMGGLLTAG